MRMLHDDDITVIVTATRVTWCYHTWVNRNTHRIEIKIGHENSFLVVIIVAIITLPLTFDQSESIWSGS